MGKNPLYQNGEGYTDKTAGEALQKITHYEHQKERKDSMAKRSCRRSVDENRIHEKAVKIRKMTDTQLVEYIENRVAKAKSEGFNEGKKSSESSKQSVHEFLLSLRFVRPKGIGMETIDKLNNFAKVGGFI